MKFRQIHLDFHTSEHIDGIGSEFSREQFQEALKRGHVSSITLFSKSITAGLTIRPKKTSSILT